MKVIGIVGTPFENTKRVKSGHEGLTTGTRTTYEEAIKKAGATTIVLTPSKNKETIKKQLSLCDGLLMQGGSAGDIENIHTDYIKQWLKEEKPLLGICMGMQLLNVAKGGTLGNIKGKSSHTQRAPLYMPKHKINIKENTVLNKMFDKQLMVNTNHIHKVDELGKDIIISALSEDGIIEAIELKNHKFALGVQWHPEHLLKKDDGHLVLFKEFIKNC